MNSLTKEQFENLCQQASGVRELFSRGGFDDDFNPPSEFQKQLVKKYYKDIAHAGFFYSFWGIFGGITALTLFSSPFQMLNNTSFKGIHSFTDILYLLALFGILYGVGFFFFYIFYDRFISGKNRYIRRCLKNGNFAVQECTPIGYAEYGTRASSTNSVGNARLFIVLKDNKGNIYVFEQDFVTFIKNVTKAENTFLIKVDSIGKKNETEVFAICH